MKRFVLLFLASLMFLFASCITNDEISTSDNISSDTSVVSDDKSVVSDDTSVNEDVSYSIVYDYGKDYVVLSSYIPNYEGNPLRYFGGSPDEELTSNIVNDAAIKRNTMIEYMYNIDIIEKLFNDSNPGGKGSLQELVENAVNSETTDFNLVTASLYNLGNLSLNSSLVDMNSLPTFNNFDNDWWNQKFIDEISLNDQVFYAVGDISFSHIETIHLVYFSKSLQNQFGLQDYYQLVLDNKWTYDKVYEANKKIFNDSDNTETYGIASLTSSLKWELFFGNGLRIAKKDSDGLLTFSFDIEAFNSIYYKFVENNTYYPTYLVDGQNNTVDESISKFANNEILFFFYNLEYLDSFYPSLKCDWGILPLPKYDEQQESYQSLISPWGGIGVAIPEGLNEDLAFSAVITEALAKHGDNYIEAYKNYLSDFQKQKDDNLKNMLDIIYDTASCDLGIIHQIGNISSVLLRDQDYISHINKNLTSVKSEINKINSKFTQTK